MSRKTTSERISLIPRDFRADFRFCPKRPVPASSILKPGRRSMQLEYHQLDRRWEHLRVRHPARQRRLLASLADSGQQTPIVVVAAAGQPGRYLVIDGYKRIAALQQLGRDPVEAGVLARVERLAEAIQQQVREGMLGAQVAMKYLVPVARVKVEDCERMSAAFVKHRCDTRQAGQLRSEEHTSELQSLRHLVCRLLL